MTSQPRYTSRNLDELWKMSSKPWCRASESLTVLFPAPVGPKTLGMVGQIMVCRVTIKTLRYNVVLGGQVLYGYFSDMGHGQAVCIE